MRRVILLFIALFPAVSWAEQMTINQRPLTDSEYASYRSLEDQIRCHPGDDLAGVRSLLDRIAASTLFDTAKDCLVDQLGIETLGEAKDPMRLAGRFLASSDERLQRLAMGWLFGNTDEWASDPEVRERIRDLAMDETISGDTRLIAFSLFASVDQFFEVERAALALAREHANANLAHRAAQVIVSVEMDDEAAIARLARSDIRAVREEARGVGCAYAASMLSIAKDATEPAWVRVRSNGGCAHRAPRTAVLVLRRDRTTLPHPQPGSRHPAARGETLTESSRPAPHLLAADGDAPLRRARIRPVGPRECPRRASRDLRRARASVAHA